MTHDEIGDELARAARYRNRAEEFRALASNGVDPSVKAAFLQVATDYEAMARTMEIIHRTYAAMAADRENWAADLAVAIGKQKPRPGAEG